MSTMVTIRDETETGDVLMESALEVLTERITVADLIRSRIFQEVKDHNAKGCEVFRGLVQPTDAERTLNGYKLRRRRTSVDWKEQHDAALDAFRKNRIVVLVNDRQAESLDEEIVVEPGTCVSFLKLVPLVGG